jgi:hypothetical protein
MIDELEKIRKEAVVACSGLYPGAFQDSLRKSTKYVNQDSRCPGRDLNRAPPEYSSSALLLC